MNLDKAVASRRSTRRYSHIPVDRTAWASVLLAGAMAPSAGNLQNWKFIVITKPKTLQHISHICHDQLWMAQAPVHIVVCADTKMANQFYGVRGERLYAVQNCAACVQNMLLKATDLGLGSCWISSFEEQKLKVCLDIPDHMRPQAIVTLGYADETVPRPSLKRLSELTYFEQYGASEDEMAAALEKADYSAFMTDKAQKSAVAGKDIFHRVKDQLEEWLKKLKK